MKRLLVFGGTSDSRALLEALAPRAVAVTLSVATDYGRQVLGETVPNGVELLTGRMDAQRIAALLREGHYGCVVDATHPYAAQATANIRLAAAQAGVPCLQLGRDGSGLAGCILVPDTAAAAAFLAERGERILLTTGVKELAAFTQLLDFARRLYVRVLPSVESVAACLELGYAGDHILAMQGPFSAALNLAVLREWQIDTVVSKDGGAAGGFPEKRQAAEEAGARLLVIARPAQDNALPLAELLKKLDRWLEESS